MTLSYLERLLCLSLASFYLVHLALGLAVSLFTPAAIRMAGRMNPQGGALLLLALRLGSSAVAGLFVAFFCVPSYFWLEPEVAGEAVGYLCLAAAVAGASVVALSIGRGITAVMASHRRVHAFGRIAQEGRVAGESAWIIDSRSPLLGIAGVFRPRLIVSRQVLSSLDGEQLDAVKRHEDAHRKSRDNFKRLVLLSAPGILPFARGFDPIDRAWMRLAESAADAEAAGGDPRRSLALAEALVRVARLGREHPAAPLMTSFTGDETLLPERIERLLNIAPVPDRQSMRMPALAAGLTLLAALSAAYPAILLTVHRLLEELIH